MKIEIIGLIAACLTTSSFLPTTSFNGYKNERY